MRRWCHSRTVPGMSAKEIDALITTAASAGCGRFLNRPGRKTIINAISSGADDAGQLRLGAGTLGDRGT